MKTFLKMLASAVLLLLAVFMSFRAAAGFDAVLERAGCFGEGKSSFEVTE